MKNVLKTVTVSVSMLILGSCALTQNNANDWVHVSKISASTEINDGSIVYALPRTVFDIKVKMERTIELPGPYAQYAEGLLGLKDAIKSEQEYWSIEGIMVSSHEEIDPSEYYILESNSTMSTNLLLLKDEGFVLDLNPESGLSEMNIEGGTRLDINSFVSFDLGSDEYYFTKVDTAYRRLSFDSTFISVPYIVERRTQLSTEQLAERAANRLIEIREGKLLILTGEANVFPQSDAAINELNKMESGYIELFVGRRLKETRYFTLHFIPEKGMSGNPVTLFNFSDIRGLIDAGSATGMPVQITLMPEQKQKDLNMLTRNTVISTEERIDKLFYRVPDVINVTIDFDGERLYNSRKLVYQFGEILQLPSNYIIGK